MNAVVASSDAIVVGGGIAGLAAALAAAPRRVTVLTKTRLGEGGASLWAQGGVAAAVGAGDSPGRHAADTIAAAAGLADEQAVDLLARGGPAAIARLVALGAEFDRAADGTLLLAREGAHSRPRVLHAHGDATGAEMLRALTAAARRAPHVAIVDGVLAWDLVRDGERVVGVLGRHADGAWTAYRAAAVVLATGGCGRAYLHTTNPPEATGDGLAMAARAGALLADLEFVQFHPTALAVGADPMPLVTEALRGAGAVLLDGTGRRFMAAEHPEAELAPRDVVARAIWRRLEAGERVLLDATEAVGDLFPETYPTVYAACRAHGLDPRREPMPVAPAAHYHMGGVAVDARGRASLPGLWACGEVAATGAHGANRLASNSLLEALVFGGRAGEDLAAEPGLAAGNGTPAALASVVAADGSPAEELVAAAREVMWRRAGLVRDGDGLAAAQRELARLAEELPASAIEARNLVFVGRLIAAAAAARRESRGAHYRSDFPHLDPAPPQRSFHVWDETAEWLVRSGDAPIPMAAAAGDAAEGAEGERP